MANAKADVRLVISYSEAQEREIEGIAAAQQETKTTVVRRALKIYATLLAATLVGSKVQIVKANGERETLVLP